jgi:hypothetical protein
MMGAMSTRMRDLLGSALTSLRYDPTTPFSD